MKLRKSMRRRVSRLWRFGRLKRRIVLTIVSLAMAVGMLTRKLERTVTRAFNPDFSNWDERRNAVRDAFVISWSAYSKYAWGKSLSMAERLVEPNADYQMD